MMVEMNYPLLLDVIRTTGIIVGIIYYITIMRNQQKSQELTLKAQNHAEETRKIQLIYEVNQYMREPRSNERFTNVMNMEWDNYDDFISKYGWDNNPELADDRVNLWRMVNFSGLLVRDGLIDASTYVHFAGDYSPIFWRKFKPIIEEMRIRTDNPDLYAGIEILAEEVDKYRVSKGLKPKTSTIRSY